MRVTIIGLGAVGEACAHLLVSRDIVHHLVLANRGLDLPKAIKMDLEQSRAWSIPLNVSVAYPWDERALRDADLIVLTAGPRLSGGESRADKAKQTAEILTGKPGESIVDALKENAKEALLLVVTNPVEATVTWLQSRLDFPRERIFGLGCTVETARFSRLLADSLNVDAQSVWTEIVGEHGPAITFRDRAALQKRVNELGPLSLKVDSYLTQTKNAAKEIREISEQVGRSRAEGIVEKFAEKHALSKDARKELIGILSPNVAPPATRYAIAAAVGAVVEAIASDRGRVLTVSGLQEPSRRITPDVALALPFVVGRAGLVGIPKAAEPADFMAKVAEAVQEQVDAMDAAVPNS